MPNPGVSTSLYDMPQQFPHRNSVTRAPIISTVSSPDNRVIVTDPNTGMTSSIPLRSSGIHNVTYTIPSASIPNYLPYGTSISAPREFPVSNHGKYGLSQLTLIQLKTAEAN